MLRYHDTGLYQQRVTEYKMSTTWLVFHVNVGVIAIRS